jgi:flagellar biosynthetic protein FlhB
MNIRPDRLDLQFFAGERTEKATPHRREESRKKGEVFKSIDLSTALSLFACFLYFRLAGGTIGTQLTELMSSIFSDRLRTDLTQQNVIRLFSGLLVQTIEIILPLFVVALAIGAAGQLFQVGFMFHPEQIAFKPERISPLKGLKRIYSLRAIVELLKSILKISLIGLVAFSVIWMNREQIIETGEKSLNDGLATMVTIVLDMGLVASLTLIALSLLDYLYQKYDYEKNLRMSKQDIKDEYKNIEGDPLIKQRVRQRQKQMALHRMMQDLPHADVVITNPTHFAVALQYNSEKMDAPTVVAKGADYIAFRIKAVARKYHIAIIERKPLARALYFKLEIGDRIPEEFYQAVAEILAYVYRMNDRA